MAKCRISTQELTRFITQSMSKIGVVKHHSQALAALLIQADQRGHYSHGLQRFPMYFAEVKTGNVSKQDLTPKILNETPSSAHIDGQNILGVVSAEFAMNLAIEKAKKVGISMVSLKNGNHFGIAGHYCLMANQHDLIGMAFTNASPSVVPTRSNQPMLGTNPISFFAPAKGGQNSFNLDMATSTVAQGKIEMKRRLGENTPEGWMVDKQGQICTDPNNYHGLLGLGGAEETSGYKGFGLGAMVDILCGVLSGSNYSNNVRRWWDIDQKNIIKPANLGQNFICINHKFFNQNFDNDLENFTTKLRNAEVSPSLSSSSSSSKKVILPGDRANAHVKENLTSIEYDFKVIEQIHEKVDCVEPMDFEMI